MPGIADIYTDFVDPIVQRYQRQGKVKKISRARLELQVLTHIDTAEYPIDFKLSWYHTVLASSKFDAYWTSVAQRHNLPESCTARYVADQTLLDYEVPVEDEVEEVPEDVETYEGNEAVEEEMDAEVEDETGEETDKETKTGETTARVISAKSVPSTPTPTMANKPQEPSPDSSDISDSSSSSNGSENDWQPPPLALVPITRTIPYCGRCKCKGHSPNACGFSSEPGTIDDWESVATDHFPGGLEGKKESRRIWLTSFLAGPRSDLEKLNRVEEWLEGVDFTREAFYGIVEAHKNGGDDDDVGEGPSSARSQNVPPKKVAGTKRTLEQVAEAEDDEMPASKKAKTGSAAASGNGVRKMSAPKKRKMKGKGRG